jgi:hypothetical protein
MLSIDKSKIGESLLANVEFRGALIVCLVLILIHAGVLTYTCWKSNKLFEIFKSISIDSNLKREEKNLLFYSIPAFWIIIDVAVNSLLLFVLLYFFSILKCMGS